MSHSKSQTRLLVTAWMICGLAGCETSPAPQVTEDEVTTPSVLEKTAGQSPSDTEESTLSTGEVDLFLDIVRRLPGGRPPEVIRAQLDEVANWQGKEPHAAAENWRLALREVLNPERLAQAWEGSRLLDVLASRKVAPELFAAIAVKVSLAHAANGMGTPSHLRRLHEQTETQVRQILTDIDQLQATPAKPTGRSQSREFLLDSLRDTIALAEFLRSIEQVPVGSRELVRQRTDLASVLKGDGRAESPIRPTSHESPARR